MLLSKPSFVRTVNFLLSFGGGVGHTVHRGGDESEIYFLQNWSERDTPLLLLKPVCILYILRKENVDPIIFWTVTFVGRRYLVE